MNRKLIIAALLMALTTPASAVFDVITESYEVILSEVRLPRNSYGTIAFKPCEQCDYLTKRIAENAHWKFNGNQLDLEKFRQLTANLGDQSALPVTITHHVESDRITEVSIVIYTAPESDQH